MEAYKTWVRRNRQWLASIESIANTLTWLLPERFASSDLAPEALSTAVGLFAVMNQYIVESAPRPMPSWLRLSDRKDEKRQPWPIFISIMKEVEVLVELAATHYRGADGKWTAVALVEAIKSLIRLRIFHESGYKMLIDGGETTNISCDDGLQPPSHCDPRIPYSSISPPAHRAMDALYRYGQTVVPMRPSWIQDREPVQKPMLDLATLLKQPAARLFIAGELSIILRPLIYVVLIRRYGLKSWKPWLTSLAIDFTGFGLLHLYQKSASQPSSEQQGSPYGQLSYAERNEIKRRQLLWAFYLFRSPFFDKYSRSQLEMIEKVASPLPLFGMLTTKAMELLEGVQSIYSYTSAS